MLRAVENTAAWTTAKIDAIRTLAADTTEHVRVKLPKIYSRELVDVIFEQDTGCLLSVVVATSAPGGGRFIVPIEMIRSSFLHRNDCRVDLTRGQVERFPSYNDVETLSRMAREENLTTAWSDREAKRLAKSPPASSVNDADTLATARPRADLSPISTDVPAAPSVLPGTDFHEQAASDEDTWVMGMGSRWLNLERQLRMLRQETSAVPIRKRARTGTEPPDSMRSKVS